MTLPRFKISSLLLILLLAVSGMSYGFLVGRAHRAQFDGGQEQVQRAAEQVTTTTTIATRAAEAVRWMLIK